MKILLIKKSARKEEIKKRFLKNTLSARLGCIVANLARLESFSKMPNNKKLIQDLIQESKFFIEWAAPAASLDVQEELVKIQIRLALYPKQKGIISSAGKLAEKLIKQSDLLQE